MELSDLTAYAKEEYQMEEQHRWDEYPGISVLCDPRSGKQIAILMQEWDTYLGTTLERCDIRCGRSVRLQSRYPFITVPFRARGDKWVGVELERDTDRDVVCALLDRAVAAAREEDRFTITLPVSSAQIGGLKGGIYRDTPLYSRGSSSSGHIPRRIFDMIHMYEFGDSSFAGKCRNFYRQGRFMEDFEDDAPPAPDFKHYYTTYHDLNITQLRAYFTWRAHVRKGEYGPISTSLAYMYIYELLCGIGADSPEEALLKIEDFEEKYVESGIGDRRMKKNLRRWMFDFGVIKHMPAETVRKYAKPEYLKLDRMLAVLKNPDTHTDQEVVSALSALSGRKIGDSPVIAKDRERGERLFAGTWRIASEDFKRDGKDLFAVCFGTPQESAFNPLSNAVYWNDTRPSDAVYELDSCRYYICRDGIWTMCSYNTLYFNKQKLEGFLHEADRAFRKKLKTGHYLRKKEAESWAEPFAAAAIRKEEQKQEEARRPKVTIHFSGLDRIRRDADVTRDSLLTEEEIGEEPETEIFSQQNNESQSHWILRRLLSGEPIDEYIKEHHLIPSVVADEINEEMYEEIGDSVLICDGHTVKVVEDYREDLADLLGGTDI